MTDALTLIESTKPETVAKRYSSAPDGALRKHAIANITEGTGRTVAVPDAPAMVALLERVTTSRNLVLCTGLMHGAGEEDFRLVSEADLARRARSELGAVAGGVHTINGQRIAARLKRGMDPAAWMLVETDNPPGMPDEWKPRDLAERLSMLEVVVPGISTCERVELRGSSARVHNGTYGPASQSHAWVRVSHPDRIAVLKQAVHVQAALHGLSFASPRFSRTEPGKVVGHAQRTLVDLAVWDHGRLVFVAEPDVQAPGYHAADAGIRVVNEGGGMLDIGAVKLPDTDALRDFADATGSILEIRQDKAGLSIRSTGELTWDTEIERRGKVKTLRGWVAGMKPGEKLRCETPFRASESEAAVLRLSKSKQPVLHDVGSGITYSLADRATDASSDTPSSSETMIADDTELTEDGVAIEFMKAHQDRLRYCHDAGKWYVWTGTHWKMNRDHIAFYWVRNLTRRLNRSSEFKTKAITGKVGFAAGVEKFAQRDRTFAVTAETWDRNNTLLGTPGGTVNLVTGELRPAQQQDFITRVTAVAPADAAHCPHWLAFLKQATAGDDGLIRFLQQWCGYCLTGSTREHALVFNYGPGGNGKSVLLNTVSGILGDYHQTAAMDTFTSSHGDKHPTDLAMLRGARLVTATETEEGRTWAEARIKQMTGGDPIAARFMRQDFFTFTPTFKLMIAGNHKPALKNVDDAARRRFNIVPFLFKPAQPDRHLEAKLKKEWPAILRWMIDGCLDWQKNGLIRPKVVTDATAEYFDAQDTIGRWLDERCILAPQLQQRPAALLTDCRNWAGECGDAPPTPPQFRSAMEKVSGVRFTKIRGERVVIGVGLRPPHGQEQRQ